ncbi:YraN family protein [Vaginella massiliensis]|uniref:YraN family protein n=1 Tax=Vaginella massiliensis TaxID=1816680 RepID=UPI003750E2D9
MAQHNDFGKEAENRAKDYLLQKKYIILTQNYHFQKAEIDIIALQNNQLIVCEVKARSTGIFTPPEMTVNKAKMKRLMMAADQYLCENNLDAEVRFDIIAITKTNNTWNIKHIEDAFNSLEI